MTSLQTLYPLRLKLFGKANYQIVRFEFCQRPNAGLSLLFGPNQLALLDRSLPRFTCLRLSTSHVRYSLKVMLHGAIRNDDL